jgi:cysteine-rich repeat protein
MKRAMYAIPAVGLMWTGCGSVEGDPPDPICGNGTVEAGETCDDGNEIDTDDCPSTCETARCNDGFVQFGAEDCDDGNDSDNDACTNGCTNAMCGDGVVFNEATGTETCDDANAAQNDGCNACEIDPVIRAFEITKIKNATPTDTASYNVCTSSGTYGCYAYTACSRDVELPFSVMGNLVASGQYTLNRDCADNGFDANVVQTFNGSTEVVIFRTKYKITLTQQDNTVVVLTCDMDNASNLACKDDAMPARDWVLTAK